MKKHLLLFVAAFALGCVATLAARSAWFNPYEHAPAPAVASTYPQMVSNPAAPAEAPKTPGAPAHQDRVDDSQQVPASASADKASSAPAQPGATVNTVCAICGMDVDPSIKPAVYKGKLVGFGCRMCPPRFAANPDRYGPSALKNEVLSE